MSLISIRTRYVPAVDGRGSRWVARGGGRQVTVATDYAAGQLGSSDVAADELASRLAVGLSRVCRVVAGASGRYVYAPQDVADVVAAIESAGSVEDAWRAAGADVRGSYWARIDYIALVTGRTPGQLPRYTKAQARDKFAELWTSLHAGV